MFEDFTSSQNTPEFTDIIGDKKSHIYLSTYKEPYSLREASVKGGKVTWTCEIQYKKWGIAIENVRLTSLTLTFEIEEYKNEDDDFPEYKEKEIAVPPEDLKDLLKYKVEIEGSPLKMKRLEIDMRHSEHPEDWKYEIEIGPEKDY